MGRKKLTTQRKLGRAVATWITHKQFGQLSMIATANKIKISELLRSMIVDVISEELISEKPTTCVNGNLQVLE